MDRYRTEGMKLKKSGILERFRTMIRLKTISTDSPGKSEEAVFAQFRATLKALYPAVFAKYDAFLVGRRGILIHIPGRQPGSESVLMAHYDVVSADESAWAFDPFGAVLHEGRIYGRGTLDTKSTLCAVMEAASSLTESGFVPEHDLYLAFGGEEEVSGPCASELAAYLESRGVHPDFILDEGGSVIPEGLPGVRKQAAMVGIAEKGTANYMISIEGGNGGHASTPPRHTVIGRLAAAALEIENHPFPASLSPPVIQMFRALSGEVPLPERPFFAHPELAAPAICAAAGVLGPTFNAMVRSTAAVTVIEGHSAFNVLPDRAALGVNVRLLYGDTLESAAEHLRQVITDPDASVDLIAGTNPSPVSETDCDAFRKLKRVISETWRDTIVAPYQLNGGTDARFYTGLTDHVYRFSPMVMTKEERATVHGINESISTDNLFRAVVFYIRLMRAL